MGWDGHYTLHIHWSTCMVYVNRRGQYFHSRSRNCHNIIYLQASKMKWSLIYMVSTVHVTLLKFCQTFDHLQMTIAEERHYNNSVIAVGNVLGHRTDTIMTS